jgi:ParB-like chromosome segregation protein Spo0J
MTTLEAAVLDRPRAYARYPYHPLAEVLPLLTGREFDDLVEDIGKNGLRDPINLFEGRIIDGRNRERACLKAGVEPRYRSPTVSVVQVDSIKLIGRSPRRSNA